MNYKNPIFLTAFAFALKRDGGHSVMRMCDNCDDNCLALLSSLDRSHDLSAVSSLKLTNEAGVLHGDAKKDRELESAR